MAADGAQLQPVAAPKRGDRVAGKYTLGRTIGQGGMGSVWVARNGATGADVALKLLRPGQTATGDALERFRYEARLGSMLQHSSITRAYDLVEEPDGTLVLVMELLRGETLQAYLTRVQTLSCKEAVAIAAPILSALDHAHEMGIVHRDVKPGNIYLSVEPDGRVVPKLLDFGIAKVHDKDFRTLEGRVLGTPAYMSPEQIRAADGELTGRSDLFSVGVVLYEMITGARPFDAASPSAALAAVLESTVDPDPRISPHLWLEIQRALAKRPAERFASAKEMADAIVAASGASSEELAGALRRSKPPPIPEEPAPAELELPAPTGGDLVFTTNGVTARRATGLKWVKGAVGVAMTVLVAALVTKSRPAPESSHEPAAPSVATVGAAPSGVPAAAPSPTPTPGTAAPAPPAASLPDRSVSRAPPPSLPHKPSKPKPVATTPGF